MPLSDLKHPQFDETKSPNVRMLQTSTWFAKNSSFAIS